MVVITHNQDYFFGIFWGGALIGLNLWLHSIEIENLVLKKDFHLVGNYFSRYTILAIGLGLGGIISFDWLFGSMLGVFLYFPAVYMGSLKNIKT